ncbi:hypothetical protein JCGZ_24829 [Jatropha curcas]|uniref:Uncharacterized protein n=1 Tax=Jatropha curcas TaxID=180498 RepID=A0A067L8K7_JATCU|nr:hypothetical protein JCGZ_24829 [Jatropha curcas]
MAAASNSSRSIMVALILIAFVLSPSVAGREQPHGNAPGNPSGPIKAKLVKCPQCICCGPPLTPKSPCCKCCNSQNDSHSKLGFP